jgi:hypothetical protein
MGAGIAASPHLRRAKDPPVFVSFGDPKVSCSSILAHQLRRRFRSWIPILRRVPFPSAALLGPIPFRAACIPRDTAFAQERLALPAPLPAGPIQSRSFSSSPAGGDRTFRPFLILPVVADDPGRLGLPSRSPIPYGPGGESLKGNIVPPRLWIAGISRITFGSETYCAQKCSGLPFYVRRPWNTFRRKKLFAQLPPL